MKLHILRSLCYNAGNSIYLLHESNKMACNYTRYFCTKNYNIIDLTNSFMSNNIIQNNHYYARLLSIRSIYKHKYVYTIIAVTIYSVLTGYRIVHDIIFNSIDSNYYLLKNLFIYNYFSSIFYILIAIYMAGFFIEKTKAWYSNDFKTKGYTIMELNNMMDILFNPYGILVFILVFFIRFLIGALYYPWEGGVNVYVKWYYGLELLAIISTLILYYTLISYSYLLYRYTYNNSIKISDTGDYRKKYKSVIDLSQRIIYVALASISVEVIGLLYWIFHTYNNLVLMASIFFALTILISFTTVFWIMYRGISSSLENTKREKIEEIRERDSAEDIKDIRISFHNDIGYWQVGPKIFDSVILPVFAGEMVVIIQYAAYHFITVIQRTI